MSAVIKIKNSSTASAVPTSSDLVQGELAVNVADKRVFTKDATSAIVELGINPSSLTTASATITSLTTSGAASFADGSASAPAITNTGDTNTGIFFPAADTIAFAEGGVEAMRLDSAGNMGLGVTPSAWAVSAKALQIGGFVALANFTDYLELSSNSIYDGAYKYLNTGRAAASYAQTAGTHRWFSAPSGTAGNAITFTQAMTLDSGGRLLVGSSSSIGSCNAQFNDAGGQAALFNSSSASGSYVGWYNSGSARGFIGAAAQLIGGGSASNFAVRAEGDLLFATSSFERARIDSSGNFLVGTTSSAANVNGNAAIIRNGTGGSTSFCTSSTSATLVDFQVQGGIKGSISSTTSTTTYATSSDYRLKENIVPMTDALSVVAQLKPCKYTWKVDGSDGQGFIAHELQAVVPDCVTGEKDAVNEDGSIKPQGIDTSFLVATLTAAIQELKAEFDAYKASHP